MTSQAQSLKTAARNTSIPKKTEHGTTNYWVRTDSKRITYKGQTHTEYGNAKLYVRGYYDVDFATQIARDLIAQTNCYIYLTLNKNGQVSISATTGRTGIALVDPYNQTKYGTATFTDIAIA
jgi:osmotically-inducible protein OsmY